MSRPSAILLRTQSDERLVTLARAGHERAFEAIVRRHRRGLLGACARICADGRAEDVLQQALLSAWAGLRRGDDVRDLRAWLYRIVRNEAVSHRRRAGRDGLELLDTLSLAPSPQEEAERRAVVQETLEAIAGLPERQRAALLSIAVQGRSQDEVAGELGLSAVAVRALVHRARTALRAAATALVPLPVVAWAAGLGATGEAGPGVAGLVAGAGGTGVATSLLKAGAVAGVAATAVSAPLIAHHHPRSAQPRTIATQVAGRPAGAHTLAPTPCGECPGDGARRSAERRRRCERGPGGCGDHERGSGAGRGRADRAGGERGSGADRHRASPGGRERGSGADRDRASAGGRERGSGADRDGGSRGSRERGSGGGDKAGGSGSGGGEAVAASAGGDSDRGGDAHPAPTAVATASLPAAPTPDGGD